MNQQEKIAQRALKPPMGWNSWDCFSVSVNEEEVKANAEYVAKYLKPYGWEYIVVDLCWYSPGAEHDNYKEENIPMVVDEFGRLIPDPIKFPSSKNGKGFKPLADYVHSLGLKFGIHIMRGLPMKAAELNTRVKGTDLRAIDISYDRERCPWFNSLLSLDFSKEGAQAYYDSIFELYASWDVDYIKADDLNSWHEVNNSDGSPTGTGSPYRIDDIEGIGKAINNCGREMVLSISPGGPETTIINHLRNHCNLWRISADFWDEWGSLLKQMERCATWAPFIKAGHWPDADMLPLGFMPRGESGGQNRWTNFTKDEQYTVMSLWAMFRSPLMFGGNLPQNDEFTLSLLTNREVININQNSENGLEYAREKGIIRWSAVHETGECSYVAIFNTNDEPQSVELNITEVVLKTSTLENVWNGDTVEGNNAIIPAHGVLLLKLI